MNPPGGPPGDSPGDYPGDLHTSGDIPRRGLGGLFGGLFRGHSWVSYYDDWEPRNHLWGRPKGAPPPNHLYMIPKSVPKTSSQPAQYMGARILHSMQSRCPQIVWAWIAYGGTDYAFNAKSVPPVFWGILCNIGTLGLFGHELQLCAKCMGAPIGVATNSVGTPILHSMQTRCPSSIFGA